MRKYILFNFLVQLIILFISSNLFFERQDVKFVYSLGIIGLIFVPTIIEFNLEIKIKPLLPYFITTFCLLLFLILIAF